MNTSNKNNPLKECPGTPNCVRIAHEFTSDSASLSEAFMAVFEENAYRLEEVDEEGAQIHAVYRIPVFGFKDDVHVAIEPNASVKTVAYIRSASRVGTGDLGVNKRRVKRIINQVTKKLK